jgi:DNA-directed RNA polymerase specialized sigma24 family protein
LRYSIQSPGSGVSAQKPTPSEKTMEPPTLELLFRWLHSGESKDDAFKAAFTAYYQAMYGPLRHHLISHLRGHTALQEDPIALAEDLLPDVFMELLKWIGTERPEAHRRIGELAPQIRLHDHDEFFDRRCQHWAGEMRAWADGAMAFGQTLPPNPEAEATALNGNLIPLKEEAEKLPPTAWHDKVSPAQAVRHPLRALAKWAKAKTAQSSEAATDTELGAAGAAALVTKLDEIHRVSGKVRIPLPKMLRKLARRRATDYLRKPRLHEIPLEADSEYDEEHVKLAPIDTLAAPNGASNLEGMFYQAWRDVRAALFAEVDEARQVKADLAKIRKLQQRCATRWIVFELWMDSFTQDEIAAETGLTRDQVRTHQKHIAALLKKHLKEIW